MEHFDFPLPTNKELKELDLVPYRTNKILKEKITYVFSHPKFKHRQLFHDISNMGSRALVNDMSRMAVACVRYFIMNPNQFADKLESIHLQIMIRMWKQTFKHCRLNEITLDQYYSTTLKVLSIENGLLEELIRTCNEEDYIQSPENTIKTLEERNIKRDAIMYDRYWKPCKANSKARKSLGTHEGGKTFEYLVGLE
jgi:hypothetical protein